MAGGRAQAPDRKVTEPVDLACPKCALVGLMRVDGDRLRCGHCGQVVEKSVESKDDKLLRAGSLTK